MTPALKTTSVVLTVALIIGAIVLGGGVPLSPAEIADATTSALDNATIAERNTSIAARDTRALAEIAGNVQSQLVTSRRMLSIQLEIEDATRDTAEQARDLRGALTGVRNALEIRGTRPCRPRRVVLAERGGVRFCGCGRATPHGTARHPPRPLPGRS